MSKTIKNTSKNNFYLSYWISDNCPSVHAVLAILIRQNIFLLIDDNFFLRIKPLRLHGLLGQKLIISYLTNFFTWTNLNKTVDG